MSDSRSLLVVAPSLPAPDTSSGDLRFASILGLLARRYAITLVVRASRATRRPEEYARPLEAEGIRVLLRPRLDVKDLLPGITAGVWFEFYHVAEQLLETVRETRPSLPIVVDTVDVHFLREARAVAYAADRAEARRRAARTRRRELRVYRNADMVLTVTTGDRDAIAPHLPHTDLRVLPNIHAIPEAPPDAPARAPHALLFVGAFGHAPNVDAVRFFCASVLPLVRRRIPEASLTVVGAAPPPEIRALAGDGTGVRVTGWVPDMLPYLRSHSVAVAPLRYGAGMKGKIGEAMASGLPVVTTRVGAEGMDLQDGVDALIADRPEDFARAVTTLLLDRALRASISQNAIEAVRRRWTPEVVERELAAIVAALEQLTPKRLPLRDRAQRAAGMAVRRVQRVASIGAWYLGHLRGKRS